MTLRLATLAFALVALSFGRAEAQPAGAAPDLLFQGFHWNAHPGDFTTDAGGTWWDSLATVAPQLATLGVQTVWIPSPAKGAGGRFSMGYDLYDYYDLGERGQKGTTRTRFGTRAQLDGMMSAFSANGLRTMADVVLNHRDGGDFQTNVACVPGGGAPFRKFNRFTPQSGRLPGFATHFHANPTHCDYNGPFHDEPFGQDVCYFHDTDNTLDAAAPNGGWNHGPHNLGAMGDSLVVWGRWLVDDVGVDEVRVDAIKHIETGFLAPWLSELSAGAQPFAVGEFFGGTGEIKAYHDDVEAFNGAFGGGGRAAEFAVFDFGLRFALKGMADGGGFYDMSQLNSEGLLAAGLDPFSVVTFVDNHDFDRIGWQGADCSDPDAVPAGNACVKLGVDSGHDPVVSRKMLAYAYTLAAEGRPTIWWKDVFWFGLADEIEWLASLRRLTAQGASTTMQNLAPNGEANQADLFVLRRDGFGAPRYGALVAINDNNSDENGAWVNSPHSDYELRDYSDRFLFETTRAFSDSRVYVKAAAGDYAWYAPTGLYPRPTDEPASSFTLSAEPGGQLHHIVLRAADAANLTVNGQPIQPGDEVAVLAADGTTAAGLGRVGQRLRWDGVSDMLLEVLGNADGGTAAGRLAEGAALRLAVYDASRGSVATVTDVQWATAPRTVSPLRPGRGGAFSATPTDSDGTYTAGAVSIVDALTASDGVFMAQLDGDDGWRTLAAPTSTTVDGLLGALWTQGFPGADAPAGGCTVLAYDTTAGWACIASATTPLVPGAGVLAYIYADDDQVAPGVQGGFPKAISADGTPGALPYTFALGFAGDGRPADDDGWNLLGVPTPTPLDWSAIQRSDVSSTVYVYDPAFNGGDYRTFTASGTGGFGDLAGGVLPAFQSFFVQASSAAATLQAPAGAEAPGAPDVIGKTAPLAVRLSLSDADGERSAAWLAFDADAALVRDAIDAPRLAPMSWPRAVLATAADGETAPLLVNAVPADLAAPATVDLMIDLQGYDASISLDLAWGDLAGLPSGWTMTLVDHDTGVQTPMHPGGRYGFDLAPPMQSATRPDRLLSALKATGGARFSLRIDPGNAVAGGDAPDTETRLSSVFPNPTRDALRVAFSLASPGDVRIELLDAVGRRVRVLADGAYPQGSHTVSARGLGLSAGVYVVRLVADGATFSERVSVLR